MNGYEPPTMAHDLPEPVPPGAEYGTLDLFDDDQELVNKGMYLWIEAERKIFICHGKRAEWIYSVSDIGQGINKFFGNTPIQTADFKE